MKHNTPTPKRRATDATISARLMSPPTVVPAEAVPEYYDLWLPFEARIQQLCSSKTGAAARQGNARRWLVQKLFAARQSGDAQAEEAVEAFLTVLRLYVSATQQLLGEGGYGQHEAENTALQRLSEDTEFLQKATAYANAYQSWLIDLIEQDGGDFLSHESERDNQNEQESREQKNADPVQADDYVVHTSQESATLLMSMCDSKSGRNWKRDDQAGTHTYQRQGMPHKIQLILDETERGTDPAVGLAALEAMMRGIDADGTFAVLYVSCLLAPPEPLPRNALAYDWIEMDDVIKKIGWDPRTSAQRQEMRRRIWDYLRFCARANVMGNRTGVYRDPTSGQEISTRIEGPIWRFMKEERPLQPSLFAEEEVPLRVQIAVSPEWTRLTTTSSLAQFLPSGELLGSIPPDKSSGAWARVIGLALLSLWRRKPRETIQGTLRPTRQELLTLYPPKISTLEEVLASNNPRRALEYWHSALGILVEKGVLAKSEEAAISLQQSLKVLPRQGWINPWCSAQVALLPGPAVKDAVERCARNLPTLAPRDLQAPRRKRGRPRKNPL